MKTLDYFGNGKVSWRGFCDFCRKNAPLLVSVTIALFFSYGMKLFQYTISPPDTVSYMLDKTGALNASLQTDGRFVLILLKKICYIKEFNPFCEFFTVFCFIWLFTVSWCYIIAVFGKNANRNNNLIPFALLFMTMPVWAEITDYLCVPGYMLIVFLAPYVIYLLYQGFLAGEKQKITGACLLLVLMVSVYQAVVPLFVCGLFACFLLLQENSNYEPQVYHALVIKLLAALLGSLAAYMLVNKIITLVSGFQKTEYFDTLTLLGKVPLKEYVLYLLAYGYSITVGGVSAIQNLVEPAVLRLAGGGIAKPTAGIQGGTEIMASMAERGRVFGNVLLLPGAALFIIQAVSTARKKIGGGRKCLYVLAALGVPLCIMLFPLVGHASLRTMYALPFASAFMLYFLITKYRKPAASVVFCLVMIAAIHQAEITAQLFYSDVVLYEEEKNIARRLDDRIIAVLNGDEKLPVAFFGRYHSEEVFKTNYLRGQVIGNSFFWGGDSQAGLNFMKTQGIHYEAADEPLRRAAEAALPSMPSYPAAGCVRRLPDVVVVKMAESENEGGAD
jgi:hypothetical protein